MRMSISSLLAASAMSVVLVEAHVTLRAKPNCSTTVWSTCSSRQHSAAVCDIVAAL
jgi:hypothetical protein